MMSSINLKTIKEKEGGGDDSGLNAFSISVEVARNGWILRAWDEDEEEYVEVYNFTEAKEMLESIKLYLGAPGVKS